MLVFVNNWYSSAAYLYTVEKTVFKIDTLTIIAGLSSVLNKTALVGYLNTLYAIQSDTADTNYKKIPAGFSVAGVTSIGSTADQDTTTMDLQCGGDTYWFRFLANDFLGVGIVVPLGTY